MFSPLESFSKFSEKKKMRFLMYDVSVLFDFLFFLLLIFVGLFFQVCLLFLSFSFFFRSIFFHGGNKYNCDMQ